jgi:twitching motility protein PilT
LEIATVLEPEPVPAAAPPTAGPVRIVAFPPQEPKANVVDAVPAKTVPASRRDTTALEYWIRQAAQRDATALYLRGGQAPVMRVRERVEQLPGDPLDGSLVEDVTAAFAANDDEWRSASDGEWVREYDGIGEVRCQAFRDERGTGLVVHLSAQQAASTLQKNIPRQVRQACEEDDGIVLVSAEAAADVLAMVAAVAQWTAQKRAGYLISVEPANGLGRDISGTFVSARRIAGPNENVAAAIRQAAQQRPDILVVALPSGVAAEEAIRAARPGCLMILGVVAPTAPRALESLLSLVNPHVEPQMRRSLAAGLRCGFSYRALRRIGGGRTIVHDVLVASREVREGLGQWDFGALDKLQRSGVGGMRSLDAALARAVHRGEISLRQAAMHAVNRGEVVSLVRQASRERARMSREERPGGLRAVAGASGTQTL